jgi:hypothetical protein
MVENNIPQSVELGYPHIVTPFLEVINQHMRFQKKLHWAWFAFRNRNLEEKNCC